MWGSYSPRQGRPQHRASDQDEAPLLPHRIRVSPCRGPDFTVVRRGERELRRGIQKSAIGAIMHNFPTGQVGYFARPPPALCLVFGTIVFKPSIIFSPYQDLPISPVFDVPPIVFNPLFPSLRIDPQKRKNLNRMYPMDFSHRKPPGTRTAQFTWACFLFSISRDFWPSFNRY